MPNAIDVANVLDGFYSRMTAHSDFNTSLGGSASAAGRLVLGQARADETMPYAIYNLISVDPFDAFDRDGYEALVQLAIYTDAESSTGRACEVIADEARERIHRQSFTITNHANATGYAGQTRGPIREGNAWRTDIDFTLQGRRN